MKLFQYTYILLSLFAILVVIQLAKISGAKKISPLITASKKTSVVTDTSLADSSTAATYTVSDNSWSFSARVLELKNVSIYGLPGSIARIEYVHQGVTREAWAVLKLEDYSFSNSASDIAMGDELTLQVSGDYVSSKGVDWSACPLSDKYCQHASFIEGGFPTSEDYNGLTISPSNTLIYSGCVDDDWINGMLAWRIISEN